jgi:hypothetical protein
LINNPYVAANKKAFSSDAPKGNGGEVAIEESGEIQIFPNPFKQDITIMNMPDDQLVQIDVMNTSLKSVWSARKLTDKNGKLHVSLGDINSGLYIVKIRHEGKLGTFKLMKI